MDIITGIWAANKAKKDLEASGQIGYTESSIIELVPEATYELYQGMHPFPISKMYDAGTEIITTIDGVKYSSIFKPAADNSIIAGNSLVIGSEDTGEPYVILMLASPNEIVFGLLAEFNVEGPTQHNISIFINEDTIHTIDPKYLPPISAEDKQIIANQVLTMLPNGDEVSY